jgi:Ca-activated chloride channel homolog
MTLRFLHPEFLGLLVFLPLLIWWEGRRKRLASIQYPHLGVIQEVIRKHTFSAGKWIKLVRFLALILFILALARPQTGRGTTEIEASGIDIVLAVDISGSMEAMDFELEGRQVNRLEVVKSVLAKFIQARPHDRIALVAFAGRPYLVSPLTLDHSWIEQHLQRIQIGLVEDGTAIGAAIASSVNRLRDQPSKSKIVILLTDGVNNAGKIHPLTSADAARALGVKVYTIAAGTKGKAPVPVTDPFGNRHFVMSSVEVDEEILKKIAEATQAQFFRATDTESLKNIYKEIDRLEKTKKRLKKYEHFQEQFAWFLIPGLLLLGIEFILAQTRFRRLP